LLHTSIQQNNKIYILQNISVAMQEILQQLGYLKSESLVYTTLLNLGQSPAGIIAKKSNLNRVSVYKAMEKLVKNGLVSYTIQANKKTFKAANPNKIKEILEEKKKQILDFEKQIPSMIAKYQDKKEQIQSDIYEGIKGLKTITEKELDEAKKGDEWLVLGTPKMAENLGGYYKDLNVRAAKKGLKLKIIYNQNADSLYNVRKTQPHTQVRIMQDNFITPAQIEIIGDNIVIALFFPQIIAFHIKSKEVAASFKQYFNLIWKHSK